MFPFIWCLSAFLEALEYNNLEKYFIKMRTSLPFLLTLRYNPRALCYALLFLLGEKGGGQH